MKRWAKSIEYGYRFWYEDGQFDSIPDQIATVGLDYAEVSLTFPWPDKIQNKEIQKAKNNLERSGVRMAFHSPLEELFLYNTRDEIVQAVLEIHYKSLHFSVEFDPLYYNFHIARVGKVQCPDGYIYLCTSNRDGRGDPSDEDDLVRIVRLP